MSINLDWYLPTLFQYDEYNFAFEDVLNEYKINNPLKYVYGIVRCNWAFNYDSDIKFNTEYLIKIFIKKYKNRNFVPILNFSKVNIRKEDLQDKYCNELLEACVEINGEIITASDILFDYIKNKYPNTKLISSVNYPVFNFQSKNNYSPEEEFNLYNSLLSKFDKVILRPEFFKHLENSFSFENKDKLILISNSACINNCPYYENCRNTDFIESLCPKDKYLKNSEIKDFIKSTNMLSNNQINTLSEKGYKNFMFVDNNESLTFLHPMYIEYLLGNIKNIDVISNNIRNQHNYYLFSKESFEDKYKNKHLPFFGRAVLYYDKIKEL